MHTCSSGAGANTFFSVRIVSLDYYLAPPVPGLDVAFSSLEGSAVDTVPVVRVFGSTPTGQRVCLHLHQVATSAHSYLVSMQQQPCMLTACYATSCMQQQRTQGTVSWCCGTHTLGAVAPIHSGLLSVLLFGAEDGCVFSCRLFHTSMCHMGMTCRLTQLKVRPCTSLQDIG
jgi:hypothetical protein